MDGTRRRTAARGVVTVLLGLLLLPLVGAGAAFAQDGIDDCSGRVVTTSVDGTITPVVDEHLADVVARAEAGGCEAVLVTLDTPGGLVTSMRSIVQTFLNADVPVVVWVGPRGADAASAGTFITMAAHVATMAPATTIGAATPVDLEGGESASDKIIENMAATAESIATERDRDVTFAVEAVTEGRAVTADEAVAVGAVDLLAEDVPAVLAAVDGMEVQVASGTVELATADAELVERELSGVRRLLQAIADPNLAFVFISIGTLAILYEVANPGLGAGGTIGAIALVLAFFSLSVLPFELAGGLLLALGAALFVAELFAPGVGVAAVGGTVSFVLGGLLLFPDATGLGISLVVLVPTALVALVLVLAAGWIVRRSRAAIGAGDDHLLGRSLLLEPRRGGRPGVRLDGTWWDVAPVEGSALPAVGQRVRVIQVDGIRLVVVADDAADGTDPAVLGGPSAATDNR